MYRDRLRKRENFNMGCCLNRLVMIIKVKICFKNHKIFEKKKKQKNIILFIVHALTVENEKLNDLFHKTVRVDTISQ